MNDTAVCSLIPREPARLSSDQQHTTANETRRSPLCAALRPLCHFPHVRRVCYSLAWRLEGGALFSGTIRDLLRSYHQVEVGAYSYGECMTPGSFPPGTVVGRYVSIAAGVRIFLRNHPYDRLSMHPFFYNPVFDLVRQETIATGKFSVGHDAWIGERAMFTPGCSRVGIGAVVGAGAVVTKDVPDFAIVVGNPAKLLRYRFSESTREAILQSRWWESSIEALRQRAGDMTVPLTDHPWRHPVLAQLGDHTAASDTPDGLHAKLT